MSSRNFIVGMAVCASVLATGCNSNSSPATPQKTEQPGQTAPQQTGPTWTLTLQSTCAAGAAHNQCVAQYGFSVNADGQYQVGPGPQGQVRTGTLTEAEMATISPRLQSSITTLSTENHEADVANESDDTLTLTRPNTTASVLAHNTAGDFYYILASADDAKSLHGAIRDLANSYYRLPFGDTCGDASDKVSASAAGMNSCETDTDCVYIDAYHGFAVVPPSSQQWLLTEDCTAIRPPVVANKLSIVGGATILDDLYGTARTTCGAEFQQSSLGRACAFDQKATSVQPVCVQNRCQSKLQSALSAR